MAESTNAPTPLVVVGAGGFGREALDVAEAMNVAAEPVFEILGVVDDGPSELNLQRLEARDITYLGPIAEFPPGATAAIAIGSPAVRSKVCTDLQARDIEFATLIHPTAVIGSQVRMGRGAIVCPGVSVGTNVTLGEQVHLNPHAIVGHDTVLGDLVSVNPNATVSGDCSIGNCVLIGASALILQGLTVGQGSTVGGSSCVTKDVNAITIVKGIPAR